MAREGRHEGIAARFGRLARTVVRLHPAQVAFRPVHVARTQLLARAPAVARLVAGHPHVRARPVLAFSGRLPPDLPGLAADLRRAQAALDGHVELVGRPVPLRPPSTDFLAPEDPKLVRYQLNYLGVVRSLALASLTEGFSRRPEASSLAIAHLREFLERVPPGVGDAWEPYVVATRLLNLIVARELLLPEAGEADRAFLEGPLVDALGQHARWALATVELHLLGNHLFTDGAALFVAGCALQGAGAALFRRAGAAILTRSLATDVLSDGGHAERSPMYQALYLDQLSLAISAARRTGIDPPQGAGERAEAIASQLAAIAHPDGEIPLLGDSSFDEAPAPADLGSAFGLAPDGLRRRLYGLLGRADRPADGLVVFPATGLAVVRTPSEHLVLDAGPLGTPDQPGHAHADALSFELSSRGERLIIDAGAGHYDADEIRAYFRGPFAHSGTSVDGEGPDELWASFRAGGRSRVEPLSATRVGPVTVLRGAVRAYRGWRSERLVFYAPGDLLAVFDRTEGAREGALVRTHLLFAENVAIRPSEGPGALEVLPAGRTALSLGALLGGPWGLHRGETGPRKGFWAPRFGELRPTTAVELEATPVGGAWGAAWALSLGTGRAAAEEGAFRLASGDTRIRVWLDGRGLRWEELSG